MVASLALCEKSRVRRICEHNINSLSTVIYFPLLVWLNKVGIKQCSERAKHQFVIVIRVFRSRRNFSK